MASRTTGPVIRNVSFFKDVQREGCPLADTLVGEDSSTLKIHTGWRLRLRQAAFVLSAARYLQKSRYPLFTVRGAISAYRSGRALKLHKLIQLNGRYFTTPILPHYPSASFDHMVAGGGLNLHAAGTALKAQIGMVLLGISRKCSLHCSHCYERFNVGQEEAVPISRWKEVLGEIQSVGAGVIVFSGGEPMERYEGLLQLLESGNKDLSEFHLHTSGQGVTLSPKGTAAHRTQCRSGRAGRCRSRPS